MPKRSQPKSGSKPKTRPLEEGEKKKLSSKASGREEGPENKDGLQGKTKMTPYLDDPREQRKFKSRNIESNWAKYDEEPFAEKSFVSDDQLKNTGADFSTLVSNAGTNSSSFKFRDESEWNTIEEQENQPASAVKSDERMSLNLESISNSLKEINVYKKLGLSSTLDSISEPGFEWHGDYLENLKTIEPKSLNHAHQGKDKFSDSGVKKWSFQGFEDHKKTVKRCLEKLTNTESSHLCETAQAEEGKNRYEEKSNKVLQQNVIAEHQRQSDVEQNFNGVKSSQDELSQTFAQSVDDSEKLSSEEFDEELNFLLSLSEPQKEKSDQNPSYDLRGNSSDVTSNALDVERRKTEHHNIEVIEKSDDSLQVVVTNGDKVANDDLEDWLDAMLE